MARPPSGERVVPLLPCGSLSATLDFYQALGFEVTHQQEAPYLYAAVRRGDVELHFSNLRAYGPKNAFGAYLVFVSDVAGYHREFADGLRVRYGTIPTAGFPRITRFRPGHTRFKVFDPSGNVVIYIDSDEPEIDYGAADPHQSALEQALERAVFVRDTYTNDQAAAKILDLALSQNEQAEPLDRARALAARAELAVAMGDTARAALARAELRQLLLPEDLRLRFRHELQAADDLGRWLTQAADLDGEAQEDTRT